IAYANIGLRKLTGIRRHEAQYFILGVEFVGLFMAVRFAWREVVAITVNPISPGLVWALFLAVTIYGIMTKRLFRARAMVVAAMGHAVVAAAALAVLFVCLRWGRQGETSGMVAAVVGGLGCLLTWNVGAKRMRLWQLASWRREVEPTRLRLMALERSA